MSSIMLMRATVSPLDVERGRMPCLTDCPNQPATAPTAMPMTKPSQPWPTVAAPARAPTTMR